MELDGRHLAASRAGREGFAISCRRSDNGRIVRDRKVGMDKIDVRWLVQTLPEPVGFPRKSERIPADLRNFQSGRREFFHLPFEKAEAFFVRRLFARLEQHLVTDADAEKRLVA